MLQKQHVTIHRDERFVYSEHVLALQVGLVVRCQSPESESRWHNTAYVCLHRLSYVVAKEYISLVAITF
jgi:hypothetical protein